MLKIISVFLLSSTFLEKKADYWDTVYITTDKSLKRLCVCACVCVHSVAANDLGSSWFQGAMSPITLDHVTVMWLVEWLSLSPIIRRCNGQRVVLRRHTEPCVFNTQTLASCHISLCSFACSFSCFAVSFSGFGNKVGAQTFAPFRFLHTCFVTWHLAHFIYSLLSCVHKVYLKYQRYSCRWTRNKLTSSILRQI